MNKIILITIICWLVSIIAVDSLIEIYFGENIHVVVIALLTGIPFFIPFILVPCFEHWFNRK